MLESNTTYANFLNSQESNDLKIIICSYSDFTSLKNLMFVNKFFYKLISTKFNESFFLNFNCLITNFEQIKRVKKNILMEIRDIKSKEYFFVTDKLSSLIPNEFLLTNCSSSFERLTISKLSASESFLKLNKNDFPLIYYTWDLIANDTYEISSNFVTLRKMVANNLKEIKFGELSFNPFDPDKKFTHLIEHEFKETNCEVMPRG